MLAYLINEMPEATFWDGLKVVFGWNYWQPVLVSVVDFLISEFMDLGSGLFDSIMSALPTAYTSRIDDVGTIMALGNVYLPIDHFFVLIGVFLGFVGLFIVVKLAMKCIPTIG